MTLLKNIEQNLDSFLKLERGWDGYDAPRIDDRAITKAKEISGLLKDYDWQAVPCSSSAVQLECHENGFSIEIYIEKI